MHTKTLFSFLLNHTMQHSGVEVRTYLGMSGIGRCPLFLYRELIQGRDWTTEQKFYCELGYWKEAEILIKLAVIDGLDVSKLSVFPYAKFRQDLDELCRQRKGSNPAKPGFLGPSEEFVDFGGRFKGHSDGSWDGDLLEIKSTIAEKLPLNGMLPDQYYWQVQAYLHYGNYREAKVIYVARDTGEFRVIYVGRNDRIGEMVRQKAAMILEAVDLGQPPICECGRCRVLRAGEPVEGQG